ncbi:hypothetical protein OP10G_2293 [Fimbriimonas ginsengisoli Gsoil 348]|uniref:Antitoxin n=2 Tax=Fimbriimonas ginsengisoli TaxID=1005039 RepID=A0A068NQG4_FIMGI|nr:hypothetical protein OP10G_2293 [Fimbriimonas ginsengisoli Gsoil 348]
MEEGEYARLQKAAQSEHLAVGEFVRRELRRSCAALDAGPADAKLRALNKALQHDFPSADISQMNEEIEAGYRLGLP